MSLPEEVHRLQGGNEFETQQEAADVVRGDPADSLKAASIVGGSVETDPRQSSLWGILLHLSMIAGIILPVVGFVLPVLIWQGKRERFVELDAHAKHAVNGMLSILSLLGVGLLLTRMYVGYLLVLPALVASIVLPIAAGVQAWKGKVWKYPLSYEFVKQIPQFGVGNPTEDSAAADEVSIELNDSQMAVEPAKMMKDISTNQDDGGFA